MKAYESKPDVLGGTPCFTGTRVPVKSLFDYLSHGYNIKDFLQQFPGVSEQQAQSVLNDISTPFREPIKRAAS